MVKISGGKILAKIAVAVGIERSEVFAVFSIFDIDAAMRRIKSAVAGLASRRDTVKSVTAVLSTDKEVAWLGTHAE